MIGTIKKLLLLPRIKVHNANALSSPFTVGFPAMTAWLGAVHALQRQLNNKGYSVTFNGVGVINHHIELQTYRGTNDFVSSIIGTSNPSEPKAEKGKPEGNAVRPSFIEEARCHLNVSLLIEYSGLDKEEEADFLQKVIHILNAQMKIAGGDIQTFNPPEIMRVEEGTPDDIAKMTRKLMPGYAIIERRDLMIDAMSKGQDAIDALLDYLVVHHHCETNDAGDVTWKSQRKTQQNKPAGWIVPIATGFHGISDLGTAKNQRDPETPHRFAESVVTLGEFKMPYRINYISELLWQYSVDAKSNLYLCQQAHSTVTTNPVNTHTTDVSIDDEF